jgi:hypothetical protein
MMLSTMLIAASSAPSTSALVFVGFMQYFLLYGKKEREDPL